MTAASSPEIDVALSKQGHPISKDDFHSWTDVLALKGPGQFHGGGRQLLSGFIVAKPCLRCDHCSHFGSRYTLGCCACAGLFGRWQALAQRMPQRKGV